MSRAQAVRSLRALEVIAAKASRQAEDWGEVDDFFRAEFEQLAEDARSLWEAIEEIFPGRKRSGEAKPGSPRTQHDNQQELPLK